MSVQLVNQLKSIYPFFLIIMNILAKSIHGLPMYHGFPLNNRLHPAHYGPLNPNDVPVIAQQSIMVNPPIGIPITPGNLPVAMAIPSSIPVGTPPFAPHVAEQLGFPTTIVIPSELRGLPMYLNPLFTQPQCHPAYSTPVPVDTFQLLHHPSQVYHHPPQLYHHPPQLYHHPSPISFVATNPSQHQVSTWLPRGRHDFTNHLLHDVPQLGQVMRPGHHFPLGPSSGRPRAPPGNGITYPSRDMRRKHKNDWSNKRQYKPKKGRNQQDESPSVENTSILAKKQQETISENLSNKYKKISEIIPEAEPNQHIEEAEVLNDYGNPLEVSKPAKARLFRSKSLGDIKEENYGEKSEEPQGKLSSKNPRMFGSLSYSKIKDEKANLSVKDSTEKSK